MTASWPEDSLELEHLVGVLGEVTMEPAAALFDEGNPRLFRADSTPHDPRLGGIQALRSLGATFYEGVRHEAGGLSPSWITLGTPGTALPLPVTGATLVPLASAQWSPEQHAWISRLLPYSDLTVFVLPLRISETYTTYSESATRHDYHLAADVLEFNKRYESVVRAGRAIFLPREFTVHDETTMWSETSRYFAPYAPSVQDAVFVPANQAARLPGGLEPLTLSRLMLPYFEGATPETLIKLRESESEAFSRFAYWMRAKLKEFDGAPSEAAIRDIVAELDYGVAELAVEARKLSRGRLLNGAHVGFFSISIAVVAMNPDPLAQQIAGIVGSVTLLDLVREIVASRDARDDLRKSEFFVPYLIKRPDGLGRVRR